jgi:hypothetical protein
MSVIGELRASLDAFGVEQQSCVLVFLASYPLAIGALLEARGRRLAGATAGAAALVFALVTDPWFHAVLLLVLGIGLLGAFIAAVYLLDWGARSIAMRGAPLPLIDAVSGFEPEPVVQPASAVRERVRLRATVPAKP